MNQLEKFQNLLQADVDALLLTSATHRFYASCARIDEGIALICREAAYYFTDSRYLEAAQKTLDGFTVAEVGRTHSYASRIGEALRAHNVKTLGFEEEDMTHGAFLRWHEALAADLIPMSKQISALRQVKEPWELERMRKAQKITDKTFADLLKIIEVGMTERDLAAELVYRLSKNGADGLAFDPIVVTGAKTSMPHGVPGDQMILPGDFLTMDFGATYQGYCSDMTRTVAIGYATEEMRKVYDTVLQAQAGGLAATKAGVRGCGIDGAARAVIESAGYGTYFGHGYGHSLGLEIHEAPNPNPSNLSPMPAGAICSAEPGIYLPGRFGVRIEDVVIITDDGCENITQSPKELLIL